MKSGEEKSQIKLMVIYTATPGKIARKATYIHLHEIIRHIIFGIKAASGAFQTGRPPA
jgi:hypothetical protein